MTCASVELVEAVRGESPFHDDGRYGRHNYSNSACSGRRVTSSAQAFLIQGASMRGLFEDSLDVDCPACIALMDAARGKERTEMLAIEADVRAEAAAATKQRAVEDRMNRERTTPFGDTRDGPCRCAEYECPACGPLLASRGTSEIPF